MEWGASKFGIISEQIAFYNMNQVHPILNLLCFLYVLQAILATFFLMKLSFVWSAEFAFGFTY